MTSFIGRRREIDEARSAMTKSRLVTLVGPGGVGKTRLAQEVATRSARAFRDGIAWIDLAAVRERDALPSAAAAGLGVTDQSNRVMLDKIIDHLQSRHMMIVLDNCEHLLDVAAQFVDAVLTASPQVRVLATSRERLGIGGEMVFELPPLSMPKSADGARAGQLAQYESVALLSDRARATVTGFEVTDANAPAIAQLCIALDGIPLAIELAAVRLRSLSPDQLAARLHDRFALLTGGNRTDLPRQQTLRALIDWSYDLCSEAERVLSARLSVFPGSFDLEAAEAICADGDGQIIDVLDQLIVKSLVSVDRSASVWRYGQLMTVREYGHELLVAAGQEEVMLGRHRDHYLDRAQRYARDWFSPRQSELLDRLRTDHANLIAALDWSLRSPGMAPAAELAVALRYHWIAGGNLADGRLRLERLLGRMSVDDADRGNVLWVAAWIALIQGDHDDARVHLDECGGIAAKLSDRVLQANRDHWAGVHAIFCGRTGDAITLLSEAIAVHREHGDPAAALTAQFELAMAQNYDGQPDAALATAAEVVAIADDQGEQWNKAYALWVTSIAQYHRRDLDAAADAARHALRIQREFKDKICTALSIELLAWVAESRDSCDRSAQLFGAARDVWGRLGTSMTAFGPHITADSAAVERRLASTLGTTAVQHRSVPMTIEAAVDLALEARTERAPSASTDMNPLTRREREVANLVAQGMSNREIADRLVVSRRTVEVTSSTSCPNWASRRARRSSPGCRHAYWAISPHATLVR